jgi:tetraacyldisaccharide 4'-kinase
MRRNTPALWQKRSPVSTLLLPVSALFALLSGLRRLGYRSGLLPVVRVPVPVLVVGNIAVGGSGKTPVVDWLVARLRGAGYTPGIVSRGYGSRMRGATLVPPAADPVTFGDEPVLLARLTGAPVAIGADRPAAAKLLLDAHPECDVIVSDDGLQHYRLARDVEVAVVDERTMGNGRLLPAGPLREGPGRLRSVDVILAHGDVSPALAQQLRGETVYPMRLDGDLFLPVGRAGTPRTADAFRGQRVHAVAGIGRPERFFAQLAGMGLDVVEHAFPDHHPFRPADLAFAPGEPKIMTSKDAVKCAALAPADAWEFPVQARIAAGAAERILEKLAHGRKTA